MAISFRENRSHIGFEPVDAEGLMEAVLTLRRTN
jgi:hypothetical protein